MHKNKIIFTFLSAGSYNRTFAIIIFLFWKNLDFLQNNFIRRASLSFYMRGGSWVLILSGIQNTTSALKKRKRNFVFPSFFLSSSHLTLSFLRRGSAPPSLCSSMTSQSTKNGHKQNFLECCWGGNKILVRTGPESIKK